jgi:dihydrofolate reductase
MKISIIAAVAENRVIGKDNDLIWHLPDDMKFFMQKTTGHHVIMGRKNFESLPPKYSPLPNRTNIVITRQNELFIDGAHVVNTLDEGLKIAKDNGEEEAFVIGGGEVYKLGLAVADIMYLTEIKSSFDGDTYFPEYDRNQWIEIARSNHPADDRHEYEFDFVTYKHK